MGVLVSNELEGATGVGAGSFGYMDGCPQATLIETVCAIGYIGGYRLATSKGSVGWHNEGANYAADDGHVKWLRPEQMSGGFAAVSAADAEVRDVTPCKGLAAASASMKQQSGSSVGLTFSPQ